MSEFKFACPVCGQYITAASNASGTQLECPTCFQKIIVPQAPASDSKFILSAAQAGKPRPQNHTELGSEPTRLSSGGPLPAIALLLVLLGAAGAALFIFRHSLLPQYFSDQAQTPEPVVPAPPAPFASPYAAPTNIVWELNPAKTTIPDVPVAGRLHNHGFKSERTVLQGGSLTLRQGKAWPPDLGVTVQMHARQGEDLAGKTIQVAPDRKPPVPKVTLRWKDDQQHPVTRVFTNGYHLNVAFGQPTGGRMPGRIYLALPDENKSFVAGTFEAEIRKPGPAKPKNPKPPKD